MNGCTIENNMGDGHAVWVGGNWKIENSLFRFNDGGLASNYTTGGTLHGCEFVGNGLKSGSGGGARISGNGPIDITDCVFEVNFAAFDGGGLWLNTNDLVTIANCQFWGNTAGTMFGGGILIDGAGDVVIADSHIQNNFAFMGGPVSVKNGVVSVARCTFKSNWGGLHVHAGASLNIVDCMVTDNHWEGVLVGEGSGPAAQATIINSLIANNNGDGVRIGPEEWSFPAYANIINSTIVNNKANVPGWQAGVFVTVGHADVRNSIIWNNKPANGDPMESHQIKIMDGSVDVSHTIIHMLTSGSMFDVPGANNIGDDPLFVNPNPIPGNGEEADFRLQAGSPAIDAGSNAYVPDDIETDLDGNPRIVDGNDDGKAIVDLGPYEFTGETPVPPIPGDLNGDGSVGVPDLLILLTSWGPCPSPPLKCPADLTDSGAVGMPDLLILFANWG